MTHAHCRFAAFARSTCTLAILLACALLLAEATDAGQLSPYGEPDSPAPAFTLKGLDGEPHRLEDYRGKVVLMNFWATWCPPCLAELPSMQRLADRMGTDAFEVIAINVGESPFRVSKIMRLIGAHPTVLLDDKGELFRTWGGTVYPTSFVLDPEGRVRYVAYGPLDWDDKDIVATLLALLPSRPRASE